MQRLAIPKKKRIYAIAFSPSGRDLAAVCGDGTLRVWDTTTGELRRTVAVEVTSCGFDVIYLDETQLVFAGAHLSRYDLARDAWHTIVPTPRNERRLVLSPDGRYLAEADWTNSTDWPGSGLLVHETATWTQLPAPPGAGNTTKGLAFSPDGRWLASGHIVRVGEKVRSINLAQKFADLWAALPQPPVPPVAPGPTTFTVNDYDYVVHLRELPSGRIVRTIDGWQQGVRTLAFSPDGSVLVGTAGPRLRAWDLAGDRELALHKRGTKHFQGLSFTADGRYLATVSNDETVRLWDARTWAEKTTFTWDVGRLLNIAFAPDGLRAAAGSDKGQIVIWDVE
jgi:WD40 repeat protein